MVNWYAYTPSDTLFCKGAEPMEMGSDHTANSIFPPPPETISGALRTEVLRQNNVSVKAYKEGKCDPKLISNIGEYGSKAPFDVYGPIFLKQERFLVPAPYSWFAEKNLLESEDQVPVYKGYLMEHRRLSTDVDKILWVQSESSELRSLGGMWIDIDSLAAESVEINVWKPEDLYGFEERTGIALDFTSSKGSLGVRYRTVREGHLYTFSHARLKPDVQLVFGVNTELLLASEGCLALGGERRFGRYRILPSPPVFKESGSGYYQTLSLVHYSNRMDAHLVATGKPIRLGGWDMKKGFHKPMRNYMPAGTVFNDKVYTNLVAI